MEIFIANNGPGLSVGGLLAWVVEESFWREVPANTPSLQPLQAPKIQTHQDQAATGSTFFSAGNHQPEFTTGAAPALVFLTAQLSLLAAVWPAHCIPVKAMLYSLRSRSSVGTPSADANPRLAIG